MTQAQLDRAVARATGEHVETIQHRGFSAVTVRLRPAGRRRRRRHGRKYRVGRPARDAEATR